MVLVPVFTVIGNGSGITGVSISAIVAVVELPAPKVFFAQVLIPFPAFDGGRILFLIIEKIKGSPVKAETENLIHNIGFFLLIALLIYVTFNDILRLF